MRYINYYILTVQKDLSLETLIASGTPSNHKHVRKKMESKHCKPVETVLITLNLNFNTLMPQYLHEGEIIYTII